MIKEIFTGGEGEKSLGDPACRVPGLVTKRHLILYFHRSPTPDVDILFDIVRYSMLAQCFNDVSMAYAELTDEQDSYPAGPSIMWYKLMLERVIDKNAYDYMFWMEKDVIPIRPGWLDFLYYEALFPLDMWIKGSIFRGTFFNEELMKNNSATYQWIGHINGNALYRLGDPYFEAHIRRAWKEFDPSQIAMDVAIWMVLNLSPSRHNFQEYQRHCHKVVYSSFIQNLAFDVTQEWREAIRNTYTPTFLIHGNPQSAGSPKHPTHAEDNKQLIPTAVDAGEKRAQ